MGQHLASWSVPRNTGRVFGYLLLQADPASLDQIAGQLGIAKSGASVATRQLVQLGLARGIGERGSRRLLYEALHNLEAIFAARNAQILDLLNRLRQGASAAPAGVSRTRLEEMADMLQEFVDDAPVLFQQLRERRQKR
jgi:DNA-binding transcriptional regulator GbsR (MarR family)